MPVIINGTTGVTFPNGVTMSDGTSAPVTAAQGGTGLSSVGTAGNVLTSNGTSWVSQAAAAFDSGTRIGFQQTAAPTGWTKDTTAGLDNSAMRIVTGSVVNGGSVNFTTAFASQTPTGSVSITSVTGSAGATTLTTPQIPSHSHTYGYGISINPAYTVARGGSVPSGSLGTDATGGGGSHDHPFSFSSGSGTFTGSAINLAVKYYDFIIASKN
jgi:hypothetical protein